MDQPHGIAVPAARSTRGALARRLYLEGESMVEIRRQTGLATATIYYWIDRDVAADGSCVFKPVPRRAALRVARQAPPPPANLDRRGLLKRLWRAAERQINEIEVRLARAAAPAADDAAPRPDTEKDARALAVLARTLRELSALEAAAKKPRKVRAQDDAIRDLDTFRRELARRLDRLREGGDGPGPADEPS